MMGQCTIENCNNAAHSRTMCRKHYMRWWTYGDAMTAKYIPAPAGEPIAFLNRIGLSGLGCVTWPYAKNNMGYGQVYVMGRKMLAHRFMCERANGPPPSAVHQAAHSCGKGHLGCISPWHLSWKLPRENSRDRYAHGTVLRGERHPGARLSDADVRTIRALGGTRSQAEIGKQFDVSQTMIGLIIRRKRWSHVQ